MAYVATGVPKIAPPESALSSPLVLGGAALVGYLLLFGQSKKRNRRNPTTDPAAAGRRRAYQKKLRHEQEKYQAWEKRDKAFAKAWRKLEDLYRSGKIDYIEYSRRLNRRIKMDWR